MQKINFFYRVKRYGSWNEASIETNIPDLSNKELLHLCQQQVDDKATEVQISNPKHI